MPLAQLPNTLSVLRGVAAPLFVWAALTDSWTLALALFWYAVISDLLDGPLSRHLKLTSSLGHRLDHIADVTFTALGLAVFAYLGNIPWGLVVVQLLAFAEYSIFSANRSAFITSWLGRSNGVLYFVLLGIPTTQYALNLSWISGEWIYLFGLVLMATTLLSICLRLYARLRRPKTGSPD